MSERLLTEQELRQKIADYLMDDVYDARLTVQDIPVFLDHVCEVIQSQKLAHGEMVIGAERGDGDGLVRRRELRDEQRSRNV